MFEQHGIVIHRLLIHIRAVQYALNRRAHSGNSHGVSDVIGVIVITSSPTVERNATVKCARTRVIQHGFKIITGFHVNTGHRTVRLVEVHLQTGTITLLRHNIHREGVCRERNRVVD